MGEFEHIKPLIKRLSRTYKPNIVVTFFSPSGYEHVKNYPGLSLILYAPFDFTFLWKKFYRLLKPDLMIISKHDVWPNQVWTAQALSIPVYLVNASLARNSSRIRLPARCFLRPVYASLSAIYAISRQDEQRFHRYFSHSSARFVGDTKFDQVLIRKEEAAQKPLLPGRWAAKGTVLLFGSIWLEDTRPLLAGIKKTLQQEKEVKLILVPHQPTVKYVQELSKEFGVFGVGLYSAAETLEGKRILIVDQVGILADLYKYAQIAFVGGSFKQGIHNVMEPAAYGIPVLYGPHHRNSFEAIELLKARGSLVVANSSEIGQVLHLLITDAQQRAAIGKRASAFAAANCGATEKLLREWAAILK